MDAISSTFDAELEKRWPHEVSTYTRDEILKYIPDENWQMFRKYLKGKSTREKLGQLNNYRLEAIVKFGFLPRAAAVQIDNYINALKRGGQLDMNLDIKR